MADSCLTKRPLMIEEAAPFTKEELQEAIRKIKCGQEPDPDGIPPDVIKEVEKIATKNDPRCTKRSS